MVIEFLSILAIPRTGTNYLCGLLKRFNEIDSLYEIYHKQAVYLGNQELANNVIEYINYHYQLNIQSINDSVMIDFVAQNPQEILDIICQQSKNKYISFKVFPNHLSLQNLSKVIIKNNKIKKILVKRNLLDVYFSLKFAKIINTWRDRDTSNLKLDFDGDNFMKWYRRHQKYYDYIETELNNYEQETIILDYERIHGFNSDREKFEFLFEFLRSIGFELEDKNISDLRPKQLSHLRSKQDSRSNILEKVVNPKVLINTLKKNNLEFLLVEK